MKLLHDWQGGFIGRGLIQSSIRISVLNRRKLVAVALEDAVPFGDPLHDGLVEGRLLRLHGIRERVDVVQDVPETFSGSLVVELHYQPYS